MLVIYVSMDDLPGDPRAIYKRFEMVRKRVATRTAETISGLDSTIRTLVGHERARPRDVPEIARTIRQRSHSPTVPAITEALTDAVTAATTTADRRPEPTRQETSLSTTDPQAIYDTMEEEIQQVVIGNEEIVEYLTIALLTRGHVLLEGVPGVGKTTIANCFARASGLEYNRVQMTPDVLPADITGTHMYREHTGTFDLRRGPIFANLVVADEINRATPKTQSALLEAMQERRVTIEGETLALPTPFMVVATQNPIEMEGVFELPEAQRDRFQFKLTVDLPARSNERKLLDRFKDEPDLGPDHINQVVETADIVAAREAVTDVYVASPVKEYMLDLVTATREHPDVVHGASPRATLAFLSGAKARAAIHGRATVVSDDVTALAEPTLSHRLVLGTDAELRDVSATDIIAEIVTAVDSPVVDATDPSLEQAALPARPPVEQRHRLGSVEPADRA